MKSDVGWRDNGALKVTGFNDVTHGVSIYQDGTSSHTLIDIANGIKIEAASGYTQASGDFQVRGVNALGVNNAGLWGGDVHINGGRVLLGDGVNVTSLSVQSDFYADGTATVKSYIDGTQLDGDRVGHITANKLHFGQTPGVLNRTILQFSTINALTAGSARQQVFIAAGLGLKTAGSFWAVTGLGTMTLDTTSDDGAWWLSPAGAAPIRRR